MNETVYIGYVSRFVDAYVVCIYTYIHIYIYIYDEARSEKNETASNHRVPEHR